MLKDTTQCLPWGSNPQPPDLELRTLPLSHHVPQKNLIRHNDNSIVILKIRKIPSWCHRVCMPAFVRVLMLFLLTSSLINHMHCGISWPQGYKSWVHFQTQNKVQWLGGCIHVFASGQSLHLILNLRLISSFITSSPGLYSYFFKPKVCPGRACLYQRLEQYSLISRTPLSQVKLTWQILPKIGFRLCRCR